MSLYCFLQEGATYGPFQEEMNRTMQLSVTRAIPEVAWLHAGHFGTKSMQVWTPGHRETFLCPLLSL